MDEIAIRYLELAEASCLFSGAKYLVQSQGLGAGAALLADHVLHVHPHGFEVPVGLSDVAGAVLTP
jgi:hypothetical protein